MLPEWETGKLKSTGHSRSEQNTSFYHLITDMGKKVKSMNRTSKDNFPKDLVLKYLIKKRTKVPLIARQNNSNILPVADWLKILN